MSSRRYKWQARWKWDASTQTATHECGLAVQFAADLPDGQAVNLPEILPALVAKNGGHNAPQMVRRMLAEARELRAAAAAGLPAKAARVGGAGPGLQGAGGRP